MNSLQSRIYLSTFISSFGSWLTFLAIALLVKENYGGQKVAWIFLAQTVPAIIFSRGLSGLVSIQHQERVYWISQIALALNCLVLCFNQSLAVVYAHLFIAAFLKSISIPLFNTLVGRWTSADKVQETFMRIGSIQTSTLALAPIAGAWIKIATSVEILFLIDALSFFLSILLIGDLLFKKSEPIATSVVKVSWKNMFTSIASLPSGIPPQLWKGLLLWFGFLTLGALLNALEFATFERLQMSEKMIGYALAAWGVGSFFAFLKKNTLTQGLSCFIFLSSLVIFLLTSNVWVAIAIFVVSGWSSSVFSGILRANIQTSVPEGYDALPVWAFANQVTQVINLCAYAGVGLLLGFLGFGFFALLVIVLGLGVQVFIYLPVTKMKERRGSQWT